MTAVRLEGPRLEAWLLHGWRVGDRGKGTTGTLAPYLKAMGYTVFEPSYGRVLTKGKTREESRDFAKVLSGDIAPGSLVVSHSNGCNVAREVSFYLPRDSVAMVWLHPALDPHRRPGQGCRRLLVVSSPNDRAVFLASLIPSSVWGKMGRVGYQHDHTRSPRGETRVENHRWQGRHSEFAKDPEQWAMRSARFHREAFATPASP